MSQSIISTRDQSSKIWHQIGLTSLPTEIRVCFKNIRNILKISSQGLLSAASTCKTSLLFSSPSIISTGGTTQPSKRWSLGAGLSTLRLFSSQKAARTECQTLRCREAKTLKWDPQVDTIATSEALSSWCRKESSTIPWFNSSSRFISTRALPTCPACSRPSCTTLDSTRCSSTSLKCLCLYWLRHPVSWVLPPLTEMCHQKLHPNRLKISRTATWWTITSGFSTVGTTAGKGKARTCLKTLTERLWETFQIFSTWQPIKIHKIWRKGKSYQIAKVIEFPSLASSTVPRAWAIWVVPEVTPATTRRTLVISHKRSFQAGLKETLNACSRVTWVFITLWSLTRNSLTKFRRLSPQPKIQIKPLTGIALKSPSEGLGMAQSQVDTSRWETSLGSRLLERPTPRTTSSSEWGKRVLPVILRLEFLAGMAVTQIKIKL